MRGLEEAARIPTFYSCSFLCLLGVALCLPGRAHAQAGPPAFSATTPAPPATAVDAPPSQTTLDVGGRNKLAPAFIALFMAGRSISRTGDGQPQFFGYFGIQILLSNYGRSLAGSRRSKAAQ